MGERTIVFPSPEQLVGYARKAGLTLPKLWEMIEAESDRQPQARQIIIHGPKQAVKIKLKRDLRKLKKQTFDGAELGGTGLPGTETDRGVEREEDAGNASVPSVRGILDEKNISDMSPAVKKGHNRTPWPLGERKVKPPRYKIPEERPNIFAHRRSEESRERSRLFREKWAEANKTHDWPSWLVCDYDNQWVTEILQFIYPNLLKSEQEKRQAATTLEAINVYLRGHKPSEDSPLHGMENKSIARRVQRFLEGAEKWWEHQAFIQECESACNQAEARSYLKESYDQAVADADEERLHQLKENFGVESEDDDQDDLVRLWKNRRDD